MRFELFLTELPKASASRVEAALEELPKGTSTHTILKALETRKLPTVSVAWSDDKRVLNEVMDALVELGGGCQLVDHGSLAQKLVTWSAEKLGRARYLEDEPDDGHRSYFKLGGGREDETWQEALARHALTYFLQLCLAAVLFLWFVALRVGFERAFSVPALWPQLAACAAGLLVAYVGTASVRAVQTGRLEVKRAAPQLIAGGCLTLASLFFLGDGFEQEAPRNAGVTRPPSLPFAGLLTELRRRKLAAELQGGGDGALGARASEAAEQSEQELWCDASQGPTPEELQCRGGPGWEELLACLVEPPAPARPAAAKPPRKPASPPALASARAEPATLRPPRTLARAWSVTLELSTVLASIAMWALSLWLLVLLRRERAGRAEQAEPAAAQLSALQAERDALRAQLVEANEALGSAQLGASGALLAASPARDEPQLASLQRELELTRSTLGANQAAFAQLKQQQAQAASAQAQLGAELERLKQELAETVQQRDLARGALLEVGGRALQEGADGRAADAGKAARAATNTNADDSAYSVHEVQEERVVLQKRRR